MADNTPITSVNSELISAGLNPSSPSTTSVDFATQLAKNAQDQQMQEAAVARAQELAKQAKFQTENEETLQGADLMTPDQAEATLRVILQAKGLTVDDDVIKKWKDSLPDYINRQEVSAFADKFAKPVVHSGESFTATAADAQTKTDENDEPLIAGQKYAALYDNQQKVQGYIRSGDVTPDKTSATEAKTAAANTKQWQKLDDRLQAMVATTRRSGLINTVSRAKQGLSLIAEYPNNPTKQILTAIESDVASIMTGGIATGEVLNESAYNNVLSDIRNKLGYYTGNFSIFHSSGALNQVLNTLKATLLDLLSTATDTITKQIESEASGYQEIIDTDPARWNKMKADKLATLGLSDTVNAQLGLNNPVPLPASPIIPSVVAPSTLSSNDPLGIRK